MINSTICQDWDQRVGRVIGYVCGYHMTCEFELLTLKGLGCMVRLRGITRTRDENLPQVNTAFTRKCVLIPVLHQQEMCVTHCSRTAHKVPFWVRH